jgi:hypothetical protein
MADIVGHFTMDLKVLKGSPNKHSYSIQTFRRNAQEFKASLE